MLPDDDGFVPSSCSTNDTLFFDLPCSPSLVKILIKSVLHQQNEQHLS